MLLSSLGRLGRCRSLLFRRYNSTVSPNMERKPLSVMFLGTASGGGPSDSRNCSSLICDFLDNYSLWLVDCAEGTARQFASQPQAGFRYRANDVKKIFITHMHADHIMGIVPFLRGILGIPEAGVTPAYSSNPSTPRLEIYGPSGLRTFVRQNMKMTFTSTAETYTVHELLTSGDSVTPCDLPEEVPFDQNISNQNIMHVSEAPGNDIRPDADGFWRQIARGPGRASEVVVDAGPIQHRAPCLGYVFRETASPNRKVVILGDTHDPSEISPLCINPYPSLLIHEATDAPIPPHADAEGKISKRKPAVVETKVVLRGHSTPAMAGTFAKAVDASQLVLNHIGGRFPAPRFPNEPRAAIMREIERQATEAWGSGRPAVAAIDFLRVDVPILGIPTFTYPRGAQNFRRPAPSQSHSSSSHALVPHHGHLPGHGPGPSVPRDSRSTNVSHRPAETHPLPDQTPGGAPTQLVPRPPGNGQSSAGYHTQAGPSSRGRGGPKRRRTRD